MMLHYNVHVYIAATNMDFLGFLGHLRHSTEIGFALLKIIIIFIIAFATKFSIFFNEKQP